MDPGLRLKNVWDYILVELPSDVVHHIFSFNSFTDMCELSSVSIHWRNLIFTNNKLWMDLCRGCWKTKTYVPLQYRNMVQMKDAPHRHNPTSYQLDVVIQYWLRTYSTHHRDDIQVQHTVLLFATPSLAVEECVARQAFRLAFVDRLRTTMTFDELLFFKWYFRFKQQAGETWMHIDPWWNLNDTDFQDADSDDDNSGAHLDVKSESQSQFDYLQEHEQLLLQYNPSDLVGILTEDEMEYKLKQMKHHQHTLKRKQKKELSEYEKQLLRCARVRFQRDHSAKFCKSNFLSHMATAARFKWSFSGTMYHPQLYGDAVQMNTYPTKYISRHPLHWGWVMQSVWVVYTSFPMPQIDSIDDLLISQEEYTQRDYREMMQYNYMGGVVPHGRRLNTVVYDEAKLRNADGAFNLEYLRGLKQEWQKKASQDPDETDSGEQSMFTQLLLRQWAARDHD